MPGAPGVGPYGGTSLHPSAMVSAMAATSEGFGPVLARYANGNCRVTLHTDGTKVRETDSEEFIPAFPESMDLKITDRCGTGCPWCAEDSGPAGRHGDLDAPFLDTLVSGTELAIGGGDATEHPGLAAFLARMASRGVVCNLTVSQEAFRRHRGRLRGWSEDGLLHGLGLSVAEPRATLIAAAREFPHLVLHTIAGVTDYGELLAACGDAGWRPSLLVLGYKDRGRGAAYRARGVDAAIAALRGGLPSLRSACRVLSFDNLALRQLDVRRLLTTEEWQEFHMGDDAAFTLYADLVRGEYAPSSNAPVSERRPLAPTAAGMLADVRRRAGLPVHGE